MSKNRLQHSLNVSRLAGELARRHGADEKKARRAGLLHDCLRDWPMKKLLGYLKKHKIKIQQLDLIRRVSPGQIHALVGAHWLKEQGLLNDSKSLKAVALHTLGGGRMDKISQILFVADFASADRPYREARLIRALARRNLRTAFKKAFRYKFLYHVQHERPIDPGTLQIWNREICGIR